MLTDMHISIPMVGGVAMATTGPFDSQAPQVFEALYLRAKECPVLTPYSTFNLVEKIWDEHQEFLDYHN